MSYRPIVLIIREVHQYVGRGRIIHATLNRMPVTKSSDELITENLYTHYLAKQSQSSLDEDKVETTYTLLPRVIPRSQPLAPLQGR